MSKKVTNNYDTIQKSERCCCTFCLRIFPAAEVVDWIQENKLQRTALCPHCGLDFVLGDHANNIDTIIGKLKYDKEKYGR